jgi:hypothetical protein
MEAKSELVKREFMQIESWPAGVSDRLKLYVYRLIDPRNGETFYVGRGKGDRIFHHAKAARTAFRASPKEDLKLERINNILVAGLEVVQVIHRHNIERVQVASEIEAALIDAYPGLANKKGGGKSRDYRCRHVDEIILRYSAEPFEAQEPLILISQRTEEMEERGPYDAVRYAWHIKITKARKYKLVLSQLHGIVRGSFRPSDWLEATRKNFPLLWKPDDDPKRWGFVGKRAELETENLYLRKRVPEQYRPKGSRNPIRYIDP